jgi:hypothetical protein
MNRADHLAWCKARAIELLDAGDPLQAVSSMLSDLRKHDGTSENPGIPLGARLLFSGKLESTDAVRRWIEGFN